MVRKFLTHLIHSLSYFFFVDFILTAFLAPHFLPYAIIHHPLANIVRVVDKHHLKNTKVIFELSPILQDCLGIPHVPPDLLNKRIRVGEFFLTAQTLYKCDLQFLAVEALVELKQIYLY